MKVFCATLLAIWAFTGPLVASETSIDSNQATLFDSMDDFSLLGIFDFLDLGDLANVAATSPRCQELIIHHYMNHKYGLNGAKVKIFPYDERFILDTTIYYGESLNSFKTDNNGMLSALKAFCHIFDELIITNADSYTADNNLLEDVAQATNKYCSKIPQTIKVDMDRKNVQFTFAHATSVELISPESYTAAEINRIFPRMGELKIHIGEHYTLNQNIPHLQYFEAIERNSSKFGVLFDVETFGKHNPQLRGINIPASFKQIHKVNEIFPGLESLGIELRSDPISDVVKSRLSKFFGMSTKRVARFRNVKSFILEIWPSFDRTVEYFDSNHPNYDGYNLSSIEFDHLESFKLIANRHGNIDEQIDLIQLNSNLINVDFSSYPLTSEQITRLAAGLPNLKELTLKFEFESVDVLEELMANETELETITVFVDDKGTLESFLRWTVPIKWQLYAHLDHQAHKSLTYKRLV